MANRSSQRLVVTEYGQPVNLAREVAAHTGLDAIRARALLQEAGERAGKLLGLTSSPLLTTTQGTRAENIAGLVRLSTTLELEIVPKFLSQDDASANWREDFFFLANLFKHGTLLASDRIKASSGGARTLADLVARSLVGMYFDNRHRPIRAYRRATEDSFFLDGEVDPLDLYSPGPDGYTQQVTKYDKRTEFNALIAGAASELLSEVSDPELAFKLRRLLGDLPKQTVPNPYAVRTVSNRARAWQPIIDLSKDIIQGLSLSLKSGAANAPGYLLTTWQTWEALVLLALRHTMGASNVFPQKDFKLGTRETIFPARSKVVPVYPDALVEINGQRIVVDAKYKTNFSKSSVRISEQDIYEALAFAKATTCRHVILLYPALPRNTTPILGEGTLFERIILDDCTIHGVQVEVRGIAAKNGLRTFGSGLESAIIRILAACP